MPKGGILVYNITGDMISRRLRKEISKKFASVGFALSKSGLQKLLELNILDDELDKFIEKITKGYFSRRERILHSDDIEALFNGKTPKREYIYKEPQLKPAIEIYKENTLSKQEAPQVDTSNTEFTSSETIEDLKVHSLGTKHPEKCQESISLEGPSNKCISSDIENQTTVNTQNVGVTQTLYNDIASDIVIKRSPDGGVAIEVLEEPMPNISETGILLDRLSPFSKLPEILFKKTLQSGEIKTEEYDFSVKTTRKRKPREEFDAEYKLIHFEPQKMFSRGVEDDFINLFRSRYEKLRKYIIERVQRKKALNPKLKDARILQSSEIPIMSNTPVVFIGIVNNFKELKQKDSYIIDMFDYEGEIIVHVKKKRGNLVLYPGDVIGVIGKAKRSSGKIIMYVESEDFVIFPEIKPKKSISEVDILKELPDFRIAVTSDIHVGSKHFMEKAFVRFIDWLNNSEEASNIKFLIIPGDLVDGVGVYPNQEKELEILDIYKQYEKLSSYLDAIDDSIEIIITPGNHDIVRPSLPQPPLPTDVISKASRKIVSAPNPSLVEMWGKMRILTLHGVPLEDIIATTPGLTHETPTDAMKILLDRRHLAPCYGDKTPIQPLPDDLLVIEDEIIPDMFVTGHVHRFEYKVYKGILLINGSTWQKQTPYQKTHGINPVPGRVGIINLKSYLLGNKDYIIVKNFGE